jgi:DNA-binding transcriptional LysR family regulator
MRDQDEILEPRAGMLDVEFSTFLAVVRYHSFSEAGERLNITQSTVSYRIRALERRMGLALLDRGRGRHGVELTAGGEALLNLAERWEALHIDIQQLSRRVGTLGIGATDSVNTYVLASVYRAMVATAPDVQLRVLSANSRELYQLLDRREIDVAFVLYSRSSGGYRVEEFLREPMVVITGAQLPTSAGYVSLEELDPQDQIQVGWPDPLSGLREARGVSRISVDTGHLIHPFLADRRKWVLVPVSMASDLAEPDGLHVYSIADKGVDRVIFKVVRSRLPWAVRQSYDLLERCLEIVPGRSPRSPT